MTQPTQMPKREKQSAINYLDKAARLCAKYGMGLGNGGDIASMLTGIASELANGDAREYVELIEEDSPCIATTRVISTR